MYRFHTIYIWCKTVIQMISMWALGWVYLYLIPHKNWLFDFVFIFVKQNELFVAIFTHEEKFFSCCLAIFIQTKLIVKTNLHHSSTIYLQYVFTLTAFCIIWSSYSQIFSGLMTNENVIEFQVFRIVFTLYSGVGVEE